MQQQFSQILWPYHHLMLFIVKPKKDGLRSVYPEVEIFLLLFTLYNEINENNILIRIISARMATKREIR